MAWCAGVSSTGAALAALVVSGHALWQRILFLGLLSTAVIAFVILFGVGIQSFISWLRNRKKPSDEALEPSIGDKSVQAAVSASKTQGVPIADNRAGNPIPLIDKVPADQAASHTSRKRRKMRPFGSYKRIVRRSLFAGITACLLLVGVFLFLTNQLAPSIPQAHLESILYNSNSYTFGDAVFSPDGKTLAIEECTGKCLSAMNSTADSDIGVDHVQLWNLATGKVVGTLTDPGSNNFFPPRIAFSPDGRTLAAVDDDGTSDIYLWNMVTRKISGTLVDPQGHGFQAVTFSPDGRTLAAASYYGGIIDLWNTATLKLTHTFIDMGAIPYDIEFNSGGTTLAATDGSNVSLLNTATGKANGTFDVTPTIDRGRSGTTWQVALSSGANMLAVTINVDGLIYLWNTATGKLVATLTNPSRVVHKCGGPVSLSEANAGTEAPRAAFKVRPSVPS
jgi:WD40-like Beta Propeller Repeat